MDDPFDLQRFIDAQDPVYRQVCAELRQGRKRSHWMWFIFPQIRGLGSSETARYFAISSRAEAVAYSEHPILGKRLRECTNLVLQVENSTVDQIFGYPDHLKFHSSMTLFAHAIKHNQVFLNALAKFFCGNIDQNTARHLGRAG